MNHKTIQIFHTLLLAALFSLFSSFNLEAQTDDPLTDHVPPEYFNYIQSHPGEEQEAVITDLQGYDNFNLGAAFAEPHLVQNPKNPLQYFASFNTNTAYRTNDGFNWLVSTPSFGTSVNGDPVNAYDSLGNLFYESMFGGITGCKVIRSTDNGTTWSASVTSISGRDKNWIAADQSSGPFKNYVYTTMTGPSTGNVGNFARTTDYGITWTQTATFSTQVLPGMMVAVGPDTNGNVDVPGGCVYVVTHSGTNGAGTYNFYSSTDGGLNFQFKSTQNFTNYIGTEISGRSTVNGMRTRPYPFIAADNSYGTFRGRLYLIYASNNPSGNGNKPDIFCRYSTDQGTTWSVPKVVNDDLNSQNNNQFFPAIWCDKTSGRLYVKWYDSRRVPTSDSIDVYASYSDDGGITFARNQRITNQTAKTKLTSSGTAPAYQGDYDAITSIDNQSLLVWTDFRGGNYGSYVGFFPDYAMLVSPAVDTVVNNQDSAFYNISVPSVKLYDDDVKFTASISPVPLSGNIVITFPGGDTLSTFPGAVEMKIKTTGIVTVGTYTITISGTGPNGTPIHKRTVSLVIPPKTLNLTALIEGFYNGTTMVTDTVKVELRNAVTPYSLVESKQVLLNISGSANVDFNTAIEATPYYIVFKHRNSIETWVKNPQSFTSGTLSYDFTTDSAKAYGNNLIKKGTKWCIYSGDVSQDGVVDLGDMILVDNDNANFVTGYVPTDVNGDNIIELADMIIVDNNNAAFVSKKVPPGVLRLEAHDQKSIDDIE